MLEEAKWIKLCADIVLRKENNNTLGHRRRRRWLANGELNEWTFD